MLMALVSPKYLQLISIVKISKNKSKSIRYKSGNSDYKTKAHIIEVIAF